jgi:hypothetical protein
MCFYEKVAEWSPYSTNGLFPLISSNADPFRYFCTLILVRLNPAGSQACTAELSVQFNQEC